METVRVRAARPGAGTAARQRIGTTTSRARKSQPRARSADGAGATAPWRDTTVRAAARRAERHRAARAIALPAVRTAQPDEPSTGALGQGDGGAAAAPAVGRAGRPGESRDAGRLLAASREKTAEADGPRGRQIDADAVIASACEPDAEAGEPSAEVDARRNASARGRVEPVVFAVPVAELVPAAGPFADRAEAIAARAELLAARSASHTHTGGPRGGAAVSPERIGVIVTGTRADAGPKTSAASPWRTALRGLLAVVNSRAVRTHFGTVAGAVILAVLLWRLGTGVFVDGLRRIDGATLLVALGIGLVTTVFSAWRWALVARGLGIRLPLAPAVADYYRALFLNAALPGGVLGDVHRAVRHGQSTGDLGRGVRSVVLERAAGQLVLAGVGVTVLLTLPSPVRADARSLAPLVALSALGALAVVVALRMNRPPSRRGRALRATLAEAREGLLSRRNRTGVAVSSTVVLAGHLGMFVVAARVTGSAASVAVLLPLAVLALLAMSLPLNVGGWGPREGVTAWAFGAAGLGASNGLAVAVVYGVLSFVAALPGAAVLVARWYTGLRGAKAGARTAVTDPEPGRAPADDDYPRSASPALSGAAEVRIEKYVAKESARLASSSFPFSADPREGRPMTPESV
ncbi:hypothetical protein SLINC_7043 [Streptomyces lincolnensis]|uniref:Uncharacterized protein n=1 Tax=Streptomyces lincolnensis TaxID=1915 RepID=A0A1B1ML70_STRLN|nr:hypothetical protein SLINC_7043 [Streptomyces lincolnensis]